MKNQQSIEPDFAKIARLKALIDALNVSQAEFGRIGETSATLVGNMLKGTRSITDNFAHAIERNYNKVNAAWLITGEGEMIKPPVGDNEGALVEELRKENARLLSELRHTLELLEIRTKSDELHTNMLRDVLGKQKE